MAKVESSIQDQVRNFKRTVMNASSSLITTQDRAMVRDIPDSVFERIFTRVFSGDEQMARDVLFRRFDKINYAEAQAVVDKISTLSAAADIFALSVASELPMLLISDVDNDGALAQAIMMQTKRITGANISVQPRDYNPEEHGFTNEQIAAWMQEQNIGDNDDFTVFVADLGTNQKDRQEAFAARYPNASLIIADHHTPDLDNKVAENIEGRCLLVSPFNKGSLELGVRKGGGVSGSYLLGRVLQAGISRCVQANTVDIGDRSLSFMLEPLERMGAAANLMDGTDADIRLKPLRPNDIDMVTKLTSDVRPGRSIPSLLRPGVEESIDELSALVGEVGANELKDLQHDAVALNHYACALHRVLSSVISPDYKGNINDDVLIAMKGIDDRESRQQNYFQLIRPYYYHFGYDNLVSEGSKKTWSELTKHVFRKVSQLEKKMLAFIRDYELVEEISHDHVLMTRPAAPGVKNVFTPRQLNTAYHTQGKTVSLEMRRVEPGRVVMGVKSDVGIYDVLKSVRQGMPDVTMHVEGHQNVGALTMTYGKREAADSVIREFAARMNEATAAVLANKPILDGIEVSPLHLNLLHELMTNMCLHIDSSAAPEIIMRIGPNTTFEDKRSLKMQTVEELVEHREWETTVEPLTFSMDLSLILPNQALKGVANENYEGALGIQMLSNGAFMASKVYLADQLKHIPTTKLRSPDDSQRQKMVEDYQQYFKGRTLPLMPISEDEGAASIEFVRDGMSAHAVTKKSVAAVLARTGRDSYVGFDFEANGGVNAKALNIGMLIFTIDGDREPIITEAELRERLAKGDVPSVLEKVGDDAYKVEPKLKTMLLSQIINQDGDKPIHISLRAQALTNMSQDLLDMLGDSTEDVQNNIMRVLEMLGKCVFQAHNITYDSGIARANFPELYDFIDKSIQLDTAPLAKEHRLAYFNLLTATVDGVAFSNTPGSSSSLQARLESGEDFTLPSIKGTHVLTVEGDSVSMRNLSTGMVSPLKRADTTRAELLGMIQGKAAPMPLPKYSIALMMKMASIHDMLEMTTSKGKVNVPFESVPGLPSLDDKLWTLFQDRFAFDRPVGENTQAFMVLDEVQDYLSDEVVPVDVTNIGQYSPAIQNIIREKISVSKEGAEGDVVLGVHDLLRASAVAFSHANADKVDAFSNAWAYERVLSHYEPTNKKDITQGLVQGVQAITGIPADIIHQAYDLSFAYRKETKRSSVFAHETHNNVGREGDSFQEVHVTYDLDVKRQMNPFLTDDMIVEKGLTPYAGVVDSIHHFIALSTLQHAKRHVVDLMMDTDVINSYGARQLDDYSPLGISIASARDGTASMRCKSISQSKSRVDIDFPQISAQEWRALDQANRDEIENRVETAVSLLLLVNSMDAKKMPAELYSALDKIAHDEELTSTISWVQSELGDAEPNDRKQASGDWLGDIAKAMVSGNLKPKMNKHLNNKDLDVIANTFEHTFTMLEGMNYTPAISRDQFLDTISTARAQFTAFDYARQHGEAPSEGVKGPLKGQITRLVNAMGAVSDEHYDANPKLVSGVLTKKKDPSAFVLTSPLVTEHLKNSLRLAPAVDREMSVSLKIK